MAMLLIGQHPTRVSGWALCMIGCFVWGSAAWAADHGNPSDAQARYQIERARCINGESHQDKSTCLREAGAALDEAKRGGLNDGQAPYEQNKLLRCNLQPEDDRGDCLRRMHGEGVTTGSAEDGGVLQELVTRTGKAQDAPVRDRNPNGVSSDGMSPSGGTR
jgi:hypothetical protein